MSLSRSVAQAVLRSPPLSPFEIRSFRFQFPADLLTSLGFEMENVILGWYILSATGSVLLLTLFASMQYFGTLLSPVIGLGGDRLRHRNVLCAMRAVYTALAATIAILAFIGLLSPLAVFVLSGIAGLVRPSDLAMRAALVAETMPIDRFVGAMGASRITSDAARIAGPLTGSALFAVFGIGPAYLVITAAYAAGFVLTLGTGARRHLTIPPPAFAFWRDMRAGVAYVLAEPASLAALLLAFLVNFTAYPLSTGLLPYVAQNIYHVDQTGLGYLVASFATGSLLGSVIVSIAGRAIRPARMMLGFAIGWYAMLLVFVHMPDAVHGHVALLLAGLSQNLSLVPMSVLLLYGADEQFRGRVMGLRMMAIYGLPLGLMLAGTLIDHLGFAMAISLQATAGAVLTLAIGLRWRAALWPRDAPANAR